MMRNAIEIRNLRREKVLKMNGKGKKREMFLKEIKTFLLNSSKLIHVFVNN
jgi:5-methylcytosine-specific restriction endonuclease McrBC GTP-binding regulatory subunit McrB